MPALAAAIPGVLLNVAGGLAVNVAVGLVSNAILGPANPSRTSRGVELEPRAGVNQPVRVIFGEWATGGRYWHQNSYGSNNEYLQIVYEWPDRVRRVERRAGRWQAGVALGLERRSEGPGHRSLHGGRRAACLGEVLHRRGRPGGGRRTGGARQPGRALASHKC